MSLSDKRDSLIRMYRALNRYFGPLHWWPGDTPFEVMVGAVLTQNTAWTNVEKAVTQLKGAGVLSAISDPPDVGRWMYVSQLAGIAVATLWNFTANFFWTWKREKGAPDRV